MSEPTRESLREATEIYYRFGPYYPDEEGILFRYACRFDELKAERDTAQLAHASCTDALEEAMADCLSACDERDRLREAVGEWADRLGATVTALDKSVAPLHEDVADYRNNVLPVVEEMRALLPSSSKGEGEET